MPKQAIKKSRRKRLFSMTTVYFILIPLFLFFTLSLQQDTETTIQALEKQKEEALVLQQALKHERDYLKNKIDLLNDDVYFNAYAKKKLLYTSEGEILFVFPDNN